MPHTTGMRFCLDQEIGYPYPPVYTALRFAVFDNRCWTTLTGLTNYPDVLNKLNLFVLECTIEEESGASPGLQFSSWKLKLSQSTYQIDNR
jgi:hypothetical protein